MQIKEIVKSVVSFCQYFIRSYISQETIKVQNIDLTIEVLMNSDKSLIRYGDGEIALIRGFDLRFQSYTSQIGIDLRRALEMCSDDLMVAIPDIYTFAALRQYKKKEKSAWFKEAIFSYPIYKKAYKGKVYYSSLVSRLYLPFDVDRSKTALRFQNMKTIWNNKRLLFVEGRYSRLGVGNDLFSNALSIKRVLCPEKDAYEKINLIEQTILECLDNGEYDLAIFAVGPTSKIIISHLHQKIRMLDLGHIDVEYEWFIRHADSKIAIRGKAVNEAQDGYKNLYIKDEKYEEEIIADISCV